MRILFLNQFFWPDTAATSQLLTDLADHFGRAGQSVTVICGSQGYSGADSGPAPNARIVRLKNAAFSRSVAGRMGSYLSFFGGALWQSFHVDAPDVVVTLTTPPLLSLVGLAVQRFRGARHIIWEMDVYPDVAIDLGVLKNGGLAARFFGRLADIPRRRADSIVVLGGCMRDRLLAHGIPSEKLAIAHNWADEPTFPKNSFAGSGPLSILYSGNFGLAHDVETIAAAMLQYAQQGCTGNDCEISFVFAGGGSRYAWLQEFCARHRIGTAAFLPYCERSALATRLVGAHIGLVTQRHECLGSAVPSKTYAIMSVARPILFIGPRDATPARLIAEHNCGWQIDTGDVAGLMQLLGHLNSNRELIAAAGERAYDAFREHYERSIGVARIAGLLGVQSAARISPAQSPAHV